MMNKKDYCDYNTCIALRELGYDKPSCYTYCNHCRVSDGILKKYPGLSDSGYQDLIWDGIHTHDEVYKVYIEPLETYSRNSLINDNETELCSCVHLYDAQKWLREEKGVDIVVKPVSKCTIYMGGEKYFWLVYRNQERVSSLDAPCAVDYEEAMTEAIKYAIETLKKEV